MSWSRRTWCGTASALALVGASRASAEEAEDKRLQNRLELWANYAQRTKNMLARLTSTRETSLLQAPLVVTGQLVFQAPSLLVLRDDGLSGSTTVFDAGTMTILANQSHGGRPWSALPRDRLPAAAWLSDRLLALFAPGDGSAIVADSRVEVPRGGARAGGGYRLEVLPPRNSQIRKVLRSLSVHLDAVAGAVTELLIAEAQGDRLRLQIADHRQNVPDEDIARILAEVDALRSPPADTRPGPPK
jgi:hypothetical protein